MKNFSLLQRRWDNLLPEDFEYDDEKETEDNEDDFDLDDESEYYRGI